MHTTPSKRAHVVARKISSVFFSLMLATSLVPVGAYADPVSVTDADAEPVAIEEVVGDESPETAALADYATSGSDEDETDVAAATVAGDAAISADAAADALAEAAGLDSDEAAQAAVSLFSPADDNPVEEPEVPRSLDGSNIESITAKWLTQDAVDNGDPALLYRKPADDERQSVRLQINYALSGEHNYEPGDVTITIPASIFKNRAGAAYGTEVIPYPENPSTRNDFNWKQVGDTYVLTNTKRMSAATKGYIQIAFTDLVPHELVDMQESAAFDAYLEVVTHKGNTIALRSNALTAQFDTEATLTNTAKRIYGSPQRVDADVIPAAQRIEGEEEYIKVDWYVWGAIDANTVYTLDQLDAIPQDAVVVATDEEGQKTEADFHGFVIGATSEDGTTLEKPAAYQGYRDGQTSYYYFSTAYPASQFEPDVEYTFHNAVTLTVTEADPEATDPVHPDLGTDPQKVTTLSAQAQTTWSYTNPEWHNPNGHFMVTKNGNDDAEQNGVAKHNYTHRSGYSSSYSDLHLWSWRPDGWYGIYPSAINELQDVYADNGGASAEGVRLSYTIDSVGYVMPWMFDSKSYDADAELAPRISSNYTRPVTITTADTGISIGRYSEKLAVGEDYRYVSVEFPEDPWLYTGVPHNINPDGSWEALTAGDGTFLYSRDADKAHWPDITLQVERDGEWADLATASWNSGAFSATLADGSVQQSRVIDLPEGATNFRTVVTLQNFAPNAEENTAVQAAIDYDVRVVVELFATEEMNELIEAAFAKTHLPEMFIYNGVNMEAERADVALDAADREIVSIDKDGYDAIRGYTTDTAVYPSKTGTSSQSDADYENRRVTIHYTAQVEERSVINDRKTYEQAIEDGRLVAETHGVFRDLLPKGVTPKLDTVRLRTGDTLVSASTVENWRGTGRTMLVVEADLTPTPVMYRSGDMYYYEDVPTLRFDAFYDFDSIEDYGTRVHNVVSFESSNDFIGTVEDYTGEPDSPDADPKGNVSTPLAFDRDAEKGAAEKSAMTDLDPDRDDPNTVYAGAYTTIDIIGAARTSLSKDVQVNGDGYWSEGIYYTEQNGEPTEAPEGVMRTVYEGGVYSYRLRMMSDAETISKDLRIYDSLENFYAADGNDEIDIDAPRWQGELLSVDVSQLVDAGCAPVVYYSTVADLQLSDESDALRANEANTDLGNAEVWVEASAYAGDLANVKAIAVDASKAADGSDFSLDPLETAVVLVNMRAPSGEAARDYIAQKGVWGESAHAYNNAYLLCTSVDAETGSADSDSFIRKDYTKVGLREFSFDIEKAWRDDNDRDGIRPEKVIYHLFANGEDTGRTLEVTGADGWKGSFENIPYTDDAGVKIHYTVTEEAVEGYSADMKLSGEVSATFTNTHEPERISIPGVKTWTGGDSPETRPASILVRLYADGSYLTSKTVRPDADGTWSWSFDNLFKYENGEEIAYTIEEVVTDSKGDSYVGAVDGFDLVNEYHPAGDLVVSKTVRDVTEVSANQEFAFTFEFTTTMDGEDAPVMDEFAYDILDEADEVVASGTVGNNGTVSIKGGQRIHVKEVDEYVTYRVSESDAAGFTAVGESVATGAIKPNDTVEARFTNRYEAQGRVELEAEKTLLNRELSRYEFRYQLYEVDADGRETLLRTAANDRPADGPVLRDDGTIASQSAGVSFGSIRYTAADHGKTFLYKVVEVDTGKGGIEYDDAVWYVEVSVVDNGDGTLIVTPTYHKGTPDGEAAEGVAFTNAYKAQGAVALRAWKVLEDRTLAAGEFTFELSDSAGTVLGTAQNDATGIAVFGEIAFDETDIGKSYTYFVREVAGSDPTVNYDPAVYGYTVSVADNGDGTLVLVQETQTLEAQADVPIYVERLHVTGANSIFKSLAVFQTARPASIMTQASAGWRYTLLPATEFNEESQWNEWSTSSRYANPAGDNYFQIIDRANDETEEEFIARVGELLGGIDTIADLQYDVTYVGGQVAGQGEAFRIVTGTHYLVSGEGQLPVFTNTLKDGFLAVSKFVEDSDAADPDQEFTFKVKLIGSKVEDGEMNYTISAADGAAGYGPSSEEDGDEEADAQVLSLADLAQASEVPGDAGAVLGVAVAEAAGLPEGSTFAPAADIASGLYNSSGNMVHWRIDSDGVLILGQSGRTETLSSALNANNQPWIKNYATRIKSARFEGTVNATSLASAFANCSNLTSVDFTNCNTANCTTMYQMFMNCTSLKSMDLSGLDTSKVRVMRGMFSGCTALTSVNLSGLDTSSVVNISELFSRCQNLTSADFSGLDLSNVENAYSLFAGTDGTRGMALASVNFGSNTFSKVSDMHQMFRFCNHLEKLDLSNFDTSNVTNMNMMFDGCIALKELDISGFNTAKVSDMGSMFPTRAGVLEKVKLSTQFSFKGNGSTTSALPATGTGGDYTGKWANETNMGEGYTPAELTSAYTGDMAGTWVWQRNLPTYTVTYDPGAEDAVGAMRASSLNAGEAAALSANAYKRYGYDFDHWVAADGTEYEDGAAIPANTFAAGSTLALTAVWTARDTTANMVDGEFTFTLRAGEKATFDPIPAGTAYQVWEETPDGWILVEQRDASGLIEPLETAEAQFTNRYQPGTTTAQIVGAKTLDGRAAAEDAYTFELLENGEVIQTKSTLSGGFILFDVIVYEKADVGTHTYAIREVDPNDSTIDYDTHQETVVVEVSQDEEGNLSSAVAYDDDGVRFNNVTHPGILHISKTAEGQTPANADDMFTFKVTLTNPNGQPLGGDDGIEWYRASDMVPRTSEPAPDDSGVSPAEADESEEAAESAPADELVEVYDGDASILEAPVAVAPEEEPASGGIFAGLRSAASRIGSVLAPASAFAAENPNAFHASSDQLRGTAYAVLTTSGELILFRSYNSYSSSSNRTVYDVNGKSYTGRVFTGVETTTRTSNPPWYNYRSDIKSVRIADGQAIRPRTCYRMFEACYNMTSCDLSRLDTSLVTNMDYMFAGSQSTNRDSSYRYYYVNPMKISKLDVSGFDTSNVTSMTSMFQTCTALTELDVSGFDTSKVTSMSSMFRNCIGLTELDVSGFDTSNVTTFDSMFSGHPSNPIMMNLEKLDVSGFDTSKATNLGYMFSGNPKLTELDVSGFDTSRATYLRAMFQSCSSLTNLDVSGFDVSRATDIGYIFCNSSNLRSVDVSAWNTGNVRDFSAVFSGCSRLADVDLTHWDTHNGTNMHGMFWGTNFHSLDVSSFDTRNVTDMSYMFYATGYNLTELDVSNFDTSKVTTMYEMFGVSHVENLDLSNFNTSRVTTMYGMFEQASAKTLDLSSFDTSRVSNFGWMFANWRGAPVLDLSNFNTGAATNFADMFQGANTLRELDISGFDTSRATDMTDMFKRYGNNTLEIVHLGPKFTFKGYGSMSQSRWAVLPNASSDVPYTGSWVEVSTPNDPYNPEGLRDSYEPTMAGTWVWQTDEGASRIFFDANGGQTTSAFATVTRDYPAVIMPDAASTTRAHYVLTGWNTKADGSGTAYDPGEIYGDVATPGANITLYAQWAPTDERTYKVRHYQQNVRLNSYALAETETLTAPKGSVVTPDPKDYPGFQTTTAKSGTVADDDSLVIDYYYDRVIYNIAYDGNGATGGSMPDETNVVGGIDHALPYNKYQKDGSLFTGWNTEPDGSGTSYTNEQVVRELTKQNGATVTLYAQWLDNDNPVLEPTNGVIYVSCKAGDTVIIPNLPAGTTYTVEEVDLLAGWTQTGSIDEEGVIVANEYADARLTNTYDANGSVQLVAHKALAGGDIEPGQFTFQLYGYVNYNWQLIDTKANGEVDTEQYTTVEDGAEEVENPWCNTALVEFDPLTFTRADIGQTYQYRIQEVAGDDSAITYDNRMAYVSVTVRDAGHGLLDCDVSYGGEGALFENSMKDSSLTITKNVEDAADAPADEVFEFVVDVVDAEGNPVEGPFTLLQKADEKTTVTRYIHTPNINDAGEKTSDYPSSIYLPATIRIPGAETLHVEMHYTYPRGIFWVWAGEHPEVYAYAAGDNNAFTADFNPNTTTWQYHYAGEGESVVLSDEFDVEGDGISILYSSYAYPTEYPNYTDTVNYGYYAVVTAESDYRESELENGGTVRLKAGETAEVSGLPAGATYTVTEVEKRNWELADSEGAMGALIANETSAATFTNVFAPEPYTASGSLELVATKSVAGGVVNDEDGYQFELRDSEGNVLQTVGPDEAGETTSSVTFEPIEYAYEDVGSAFTYYLREVAGTNENMEYDASTYRVDVTVEDTGTGVLDVKAAYTKLGADEDSDETVDVIEFENAYLTTSVAGQKVWADGDDADGARPESITVRLLANGREYDSREVTAEDGWTFEFGDLPVMSGGAPIEYTVSEDPVAGYGLPTITGSAEKGFVVENPYDYETVDIAGAKTWDDADDQDGARPASITVRLFADGEEVASKTVGADDDWAWSFTDLPKNHGGAPIAYTLTEDAVAGYSTTYDGFDVTNERTPGKTSVSVVKSWDDADDADSIRPVTVVVHLLANGEDTGKTLELSADNAWTGSFTELDEYANGERIAYTVEEELVEGYDDPYVTGSAETGYVVTNPHTPDAPPDPTPPDSPENPPVPGSPSTPGGSGSGSPKGPLPDTGDSVSPVPYATLALLGAACVAAGAVIRKKPQRGSHSR